MASRTAPLVLSSSTYDCFGPPLLDTAHEPVIVRKDYRTVRPLNTPTLLPYTVDSVGHFRPSSPHVDDFSVVGVEYSVQKLVLSRFNKDFNNSALKVHLRSKSFIKRKN